MVDWLRFFATLLLFPVALLAAVGALGVRAAPVPGITSAVELGPAAIRSGG